MIENLLQHLDSVLLVLFGAGALVGAGWMILAQQPMRTAASSKQSDVVSPSMFTSPSPNCRS